MKKLMTIGLVIFLSHLSSAYAETFKWVDKEGRTHFSDQPQDENSESIKLPKFRADPVLQEREQQRRESLQQNQEMREMEKTAQKSAEEDKQLREKNCKTATDAVERYKTVGRLFKKNEKGEREFLSDEERAAEMKKMQEARKKWCD